MEESSFIDQPRGVRAGEELDEQKLASYLRAHLPNLHAALTVKQFPSGFSNLTYLLQFGDRQLVLRRPPIGAKIKTAHDMGREFRILSHLHPVYRKVPEPLLFCEDEAVIGAPFYVMERVKRNHPAGAVARRLPADARDNAPSFDRHLLRTWLKFTQLIIAERDWAI